MPYLRAVVEVLEWCMQRKLYIYPSLLSGADKLDDKLRMELVKLQSAYGRMPVMASDGVGGHAGPGDPCGETVANVIVPIKERIAKLNVNQAEQSAVLSEVEDYIGSLDALEQNVIRLRYFKRKSWDEISVIEGYSRSTACRIHASAVAKSPIPFGNINRDTV